MAYWQPPMGARRSIYSEPMPAQSTYCLQPWSCRSRWPFRVPPDQHQTTKHECALPVRRWHTHRLSARQAEALADTIATIDLQIISGIVFPGHSGIHLAEHVEASQRKVSTLLISHFDRDLLHKMPGFSRQPEFLPNPFTAEALLTRVRWLLDA